VSGNTLIFTPATSFMPGETVKYTVTTAAASTNGNLAQARVGQFTTAAGGTGSGVFTSVSTLNLGPDSDRSIGAIATGDIDGDGDLDMLVSNTGSTVNALNVITPLLNNGNGTFSSGQNVSIVGDTREITLGDIDGDGDLDFLYVSLNNGSMIVQRNNGSGGFSISQSLGMSLFPASVKLGDVDGDGDLDSFVTNSYGNTVSIRLNNGNGMFSGGQELAVAAYPAGLALGDIDNDGDVDVITGNTVSNNFSVRLNDGSGNFTNGQTISSGIDSNNTNLVDIDGDNDLDILTTGLGSITLYTNSGTGQFTNSQSISLGSGPPLVLSVASGDIDGDGDLDLIATSITPASVARTVSVYLNNGSGGFSASQTPGTLPTAISGLLGDIDGDGDLDLLTTNTSGSAGIVSVHLNGRTTLATTPKSLAAALTLYPNPARRAVTITGTAPHALCQVHDALGRVVLAATTDATGTAHLSLPESMVTGTYLVRINEQTRRLLVE
jgi:hypothetical protein